MRVKRKMNICIRNRILFLFLAVAVIPGAYARAQSNGRLVMAGDRADIGFTCRLPNGEIAISSYKEVAQNPSLPKSRIFMPRDRSNPVPVTAGRIPEELRGSPEKGFEGEVLGRLSRAIIGLPFGGKHSVDLVADRLPEGQKDEYFLKMARVRQRGKEMRFTPQEYRAKAGKDAEVGKELVIDPAIPGIIASVNEKEVVVRFAPSDREVNTPLGRGTVRELPDKYEIVINARPGDLVRSRGWIGRIVAVDDRYISIDYGHPFGGEALRCEVTVELTKPEEPGKESRPALAGGGAAKISQRDDQGAGVLRVEEGDLVRVNYTAALEDGSILFSTDPGRARSGNVKKAPGYSEPKTFGPEEVLAGKPARIPGVGQFVVGMEPGEKKRVTIGPELAYGSPDPRKVQTFPAVKTYPQFLRMSPANFVRQFNIFPIPGTEVPFSPYFKARVKRVLESSAELELLVKDGGRFELEYGSVEVRVEGDEVSVALRPRVGAPFRTEAGQGVISGTDGKTFRVDLNPPVAGKAVILDMEVVSVTPAAAFRTMAIPWSEEHDEGLAAARRSGKPALLILYADWCGWSKKLLNETLDDPRLKAVRDRLVWIKINSDKDKNLQARYGQNGFPLILFLDRDGRVARRIEGFADAATLREELESLLGNPAAGKI